MDSKIIIKILIVGLTTVLTLIVFTQKDFLKVAGNDVEAIKRSNI